MKSRLVRVVTTVGLAATAQVSAAATHWFVAVGGIGPGSSTAPFGRIQDALNAARPGDVITVQGGTYRESIRTVRDGAAGSPIVLRAEHGRGSVVVTATGRVLTVDHPYFAVDGLVLDGQYGANDSVRVGNGAHSFALRNTEVRESSRDLIDIGSPQGVLIENCLVHHALNPTDGRSDAHGIVAGAVQDLTIRNTDIHTFSGDGIQVDPGRSVPGWNRVTIEGGRIWLAPLPAAENGFAAGVIPGENAVDTKASSSLPRSTIVIRDTVAWGFRSELMTNAAAFNLKENIDATVDGVTVHDSEIAFRLRGPTKAQPAGAWVAVKNAVVYDVVTGVRYENHIQNLRVWNTTIGSGVSRAFQAASSSPGGLDVRNLLVLGTLPREAARTPGHRLSCAVGLVDGEHLALAVRLPARQAREQPLVEGQGQEDGGEKAG
jgi:hypothetical protein